MNNSKEFTLLIPNKEGVNEEVKTSHSIIFIGANGSGKTRLGTWIEFEYTNIEKVHRISAQKSLAMPDSTTLRSLNEATAELLTGTTHILQEPQHRKAYKTNARWQSKPAISFLDDFVKLMVYLFSDHANESIKYRSESRNTIQKVSPKNTKLETLKFIWESILPHRELFIDDIRIQTNVKGIDSKYNSSEMSDGERVIFYLIGQCLATPENGVIIIDEPELHLHKSIQTPLWNAIENQRPDCLFIYLTHDLDFAVSMNEAQKVWVKSYDGKKWDWEIVQNIDGLPEKLLLEILGSRKSIVFVEGINGSYDTALYSLILEDFLVVPVGSCTQVIQSTKALRKCKHLHNLDVFGIIDRDRRPENEIQSLENDGIYTLEVAEVENLFCTKEILEIVSEKLSRDSKIDFESIKKYILDELKKELDNQIIIRTTSEVRFRLNLFDEKSKNVDDIESNLLKLAKSINVKTLYDENKKVFEKIINNSDYELLLKIYNRKSLASRVGEHLGLKKGELPEFIIRLAKTDSQIKIKNALKPYFGNFGQFMN